MTDYKALKALCAELHAAFNTYAVDMAHHDLLEFARAVLVEPEPPADGEVAEFVAQLKRYAKEGTPLRLVPSMVARAADLLERLAPQPELEGPIDGPAVQSREPASVMEEPSDEAIESWAAASSVPGEFLDPDSGRWERCLSSEEFCATVRAALDEWGTPNLAQVRSSLGDGSAVPGRPSDEELTLTYAYAVAAAVDNKRGPFKNEDVEAAQLAGLRAVLARWGQAPNA